MKRKKFWRGFVIVALFSGLGLCCLHTASKLAGWESPQYQAYNEGLAALKAEKVDEAMLAFDKSLDAYAAGKDEDSLLYPRRSTELAALAMSKKAFVFLMKQKPELAVKAFKESIALNPGTLDPQLLDELMRGEKLSPADVSRLAEQSSVVKHNLELLFKKNQSMQNQEGKGKGKPGDKDAKPGDQPANGSKPGPGSGKGNPNAI